MSSTLRINPGGSLEPSEIIGRDAFVATVWRALQRQSVLLTAERRMGKTSVLNKMVSEGAAGMYPVKRSLQGITSADEFVRGLLADTESVAPGLLKRSLGKQLRKAGVKQIGVSKLSVEFEPPSDESWKEVASETFAVLDRDVDVVTVFLWDELPHMIANIRDNHGSLAAREMLDVLRHLRETYAGVRMVFSGSLGLHHVVDGLRVHGGMWVPTHDMLAVDVPTLRLEDATYLAFELLRNEQLICDDAAVVSDTIAREVDGAPYYVHHVIHQLQERQQNARMSTIDSASVEAIVEEVLRNPLDPWQVQHYVDRIGSYYGEDATYVKAVLDTIAQADAALTLEEIAMQIGSQVKPPTNERVRDVLGLLCKDYYLMGGPAYDFRLSLLRRAWIARRAPTP